MPENNSRCRRLVLLLDGTWNKREDTTNVWRMSILLRQDQTQRLYYDEGVGTLKGEAIAGGAFGHGLSAKVLSAYLWLMEMYEDGDESPNGLSDELYIFGFSRGAYAARSLVGLISIVGLLHRSAPRRVMEAFELSRIEGVDENSPIARDFRQRFSRPVKVKFLGVWDTVGALGVPRVKGLPQIKLRTLEDNSRHKVVELPSIVEFARHAIALDENRSIFEVTFWPKANSQQSLEQRWFVGAHANVGGGYERDGLFQRPLQWLQHEAKACGLVFRELILHVNEAFYISAPRNPLDEIAYGAYRLTQWIKPHVRELTFHGPSNQVVDYTVLERWIWNPLYRPKSLEPYLHRWPWRPKSMRMSDQSIQELLPDLDASVSPTRGYALRPMTEQ
jgi:hypothetical protein